MLNVLIKYNLKYSLKLGLGKPYNTIDKNKWQLTFSDEFEGNSIDTDKWFTRYIDRPNVFNWNLSNADGKTPPKEYYDDSAISVSNGILKLNIEKDKKTMVVKDWYGIVINPKTNSPYFTTIENKVGVVVAKQGEKAFSQRFGYFEAKCKMPKSSAAWPAFWLYGSVNWPPEIDIFEVYTKNSFSSFNSNYHWGINNDGIPVSKREAYEHDSDVKTHKLVNLSEDFHVYACEWDSLYIKWYFDNILVRVAYKNVTSICEALTVIMNNAVDDINAKDYNNDLTLPTSFEIEYIKIYSKK